VDWANSPAQVRIPKSSHQVSYDEAIRFALNAFSHGRAHSLPQST
jgi:hypothetical protein